MTGRLSASGRRVKSPEMLLADGIALGLVIGLLRKGRLANFRHTQVWGEPLLMGTLVLQILTPALAASLSIDPALTFTLWLCLMIVACVVALKNAARSGMTWIAVGIALNMLVIALNGAMPVSAQAVQAVDPLVRVETLSFDHVHEVLGESTRLPWLADVIPVPGPRWHRGVASIGDIVLVAGLSVFIQQGMLARDGLD